MLATTRILSSERGWRAFVAAVLVGSVLVRVLCILVDRAGGDDLQIYVYFGRLVLRGDNPYDAPETGPIDPDYGDNPVGELGFFAAVLSIYDSRTTLRGAFILADLATLALLAFGYVRSRWWKAQLMLFYAFNPLILHQWAVNGDDKTVLFALIVALLVSLERGWMIAAWLATTALGVLKWLSAYFFLPLLCSPSPAGRGAFFAPLLVAGASTPPHRGKHGAVLPRQPHAHHAAQRAARVRARTRELHESSRRLRGPVSPGDRQRLHGRGGPGDSHPLRHLADRHSGSCRLFDRSGVPASCPTTG